MKVGAVDLPSFLSVFDLSRLSVRNKVWRGLFREYYRTWGTTACNAEVT